MRVVKLLSEMLHMPKKAKMKLARKKGEEKLGKTNEYSCNGLCA